MIHYVDRDKIDFRRSMRNCNCIEPEDSYWFDNYAQVCCCCCILQLVCWALQSCGDVLFELPPPSLTWRCAPLGWIQLLTCKQDAVADCWVCCWQLWRFVASVFIGLPWFNWKQRGEIGLHWLVTGHGAECTLGIWPLDVTIGLYWSDGWLHWALGWAIFDGLGMGADRWVQCGDNCWQLFVNCICD